MIIQKLINVSTGWVMYWMSWRKKTRRGGEARSTAKREYFQRRMLPRYKKTKTTCLVKGQKSRASEIIMYRTTRPSAAGNRSKLKLIHKFFCHQQHWFWRQSQKHRRKDTNLRQRDSSHSWVALAVKQGCWECHAARSPESILKTASVDL